MKTRLLVASALASLALLSLAPLAPAHASDLPSPDDEYCYTNANGIYTCTTQTWTFVAHVGETFLPPNFGGEGDPEQRCPHPRELPVYFEDTYQITYHSTFYDENGEVIGTSTRTGRGDHFEFVRCERYTGRVYPHPGQSWHQFSPGQAWHRYE